MVNTSFQVSGTGDFGKRRLGLGHQRHDAHLLLARFPHGKHRPRPVGRAVADTSKQAIFHQQTGIVGIVTGLGALREVLAEPQLGEELRRVRLLIDGIEVGAGGAQLGEDVTRHHPGRYHDR